MFPCRGNSRIALVVIMFVVVVVFVVAIVAVRISHLTDLSSDVALTALFLCWGIFTWGSAELSVRHHPRLLNAGLSARALVAAFGVVNLNSFPAE